MVTIQKQIYGLCCESDIVTSQALGQLHKHTQGDW